MLLGVALIVLFFLLELLYLKISHKVQILDKPNERSSHESITIRGGGIIFPIACFMILFFQTYPHWILFSTSLLIISIVSFIDDLRNIDSKLRLLIQGIAVIGLLFPFSSLLSWYMLFVVFVGIISIVNAYNFMDGINGITALYSLIALSSLLWANRFISELVPETFLVSLIASILVFSFFNVRKRAVCFAGDVGSVSIAFIICFLLLRLIINTGSVWWLGFLSIYGIDTVFTIFCRILRKEGLMQAHRSHFYQYLANETHWSHIKVSFLYAGIQLLINLVTIYEYFQGEKSLVVIILFATLLIYIIFRLRFEGRYRLFTAYNR